MASLEPGASGAALTLPVGEGDHVRGADSARVTLLEYGDFECERCGRAYPMVKQLQREFGEGLRFVFRSFPITSSHPHAQHAAEAAEWAATLGAFWPMHDALYENQGALADAEILARAVALGLPAASLAQAWAAHAFIPRVKRDFLSGIASGVNGTPAFFIDGFRHLGPWDVDDLRRALERALQRSG
jgi:protein-disulfide isomerase